MSKILTVFGASAWIWVCLLIVADNNIRDRLDALEAASEPLGMVESARVTDDRMEVKQPELRVWWADTAEDAQALCAAAVLRFGWTPCGFAFTNGRYRVWATVSK